MPPGSRIMEKIMMRLHEDGILALPVHDSTIVEEEHPVRFQKIIFQVYKDAWDKVSAVSGIISGILVYSRRLQLMGALTTSDIDVSVQSY